MKNKIVNHLATDIAQQVGMARQDWEFCQNDQPNSDAVCVDRDVFMAMEARLSIALRLLELLK